MLIDLLFAANGETWDSLQPYVTTHYRDKDRIDQAALTRFLDQLKRDE